MLIIGELIMVMDAVDDQHRHPNQREPSELLDSKKTGEQDTGKKIDATDHCLVDQCPIDVAVSA